MDITELSAFESAVCHAAPFRHWTLPSAFPDDLAESLAVLPFAPPSIVDTEGRRETHNSTRTFFNAEQQGQYPACRAVAEVFQNPKTVAAIGRMTGADLHGSYLRIEYCLDGDGFWLEPHTDIGAKRLTLLAYLSRGAESESWGTDFLDDEHALVKRVPCRFNTGVLFLPAADTWHSFPKRPIDGVRRTVIVNYVGPEWRARHELCFPGRAVRSESC